MDSSDPLRLAVVIGSNREGRFGGIVAHWFLEVIAGTDGLDLDVLDLADLDLHTRIGIDPPEPMQSVFGRVAGGIDVIDKIAAAKTGRVGGHDDVPLEPIVVTLVRRTSAA